MKILLLTKGIPNKAITDILVDYSFKVKLPEKREDRGIPTILAQSNIRM
jgi:hypothetical protein